MAVKTGKGCVCPETAGVVCNQVSQSIFGVFGVLGTNITLIKCSCLSSPSRALQCECKAKNRSSLMTVLLKKNQAFASEHRRSKDRFVSTVQFF